MKVIECSQSESNVKNIEFFVQYLLTTKKYNANIVHACGCGGMADAHV